MHLIQGLNPSPLQCMRKYALFCGSQLAPGTVVQSTAPGADTVRGAVLASPKAFHYATETVCAK